MPYIILLIAAVCSAVVVNGQTSVEALHLEHGQYMVGFQHYTTYDSSRTYEKVYDLNNELHPRPIPISLWYPREKVSSQALPLSILAYLEILKLEEEWEHLPNEQILNWFYYANTPENRKHLNENAYAYENAKPLDGKFPVIVYAPSFMASSVENFALCEYLASHGYIVISSPSRGADSRSFEGGGIKDLETQARDIEFLIGQIKHIASTDFDKIATIGFSFGGLSNVLASIRNHYIKAIVSLDGAIKYQYYKLKASPFFDLHKLDIPFIHMSQKNIPMEVMLADGIDTTLNNTFEFYDSLKYSEAYHLTFNDLTHPYFSSLGVLFQSRDLRQDKSDAVIMVSYQLVCTYTLEFLNAYLKDNKDSYEFLNRRPTDNKIEENIIDYKKKIAVKKILDLRDFNELAANQNYENLDSLYLNLSAEQQNFHLPEWQLNNLGLQLTFHPDKIEWGLAVLEFATSRYPNSGNLYDSLGEAYFFAKKMDKAASSFEKSLLLSPQNQHAKDRLELIRSKD